MVAGLGAQHLPELLLRELELSFGDVKTPKIVARFRGAGHKGQGMLE